VAPILEAFRVSQADLAQARAILDENASAVFQINGMMCEPSTHRAWAQRIQARSTFFGVTDARLKPDFDEVYG
jgi:citrate lyase beta subunit